MDLKSLFPGVVERSWYVGGLQICLRSGTFACDRSLNLPQCKAMMTPGMCAGVQATHNAVLGQLKGAAVLCQEAIAQRFSKARRGFRWACSASLSSAGTCSRWPSRGSMLRARRG